MTKLQRLRRAISNFITYPRYPAYSIRPDTFLFAKIYFYIGICIHPIEYFYRKINLKKLPPSKLKIDKNKGFLVLAKDEIKITNELSTYCQKLFAEQRPHLESQTQKKKFLLQKWLLPNPNEHQIIWKFATDPDILSIVSSYLGYVPLVGSTLLWYSPNEAMEDGRSQMYHLDGEDIGQIKVFFYLSDVDATSGPLTLISARESKQIFTTLYKENKVFRRNTKISDETVFSITDKSSESIITGKSGTIALVDTDRCYHYGSRPGNKPRLLLQIQYLSPFSIHQPLFGRKKSNDFMSSPISDLGVPKDLVLGYQHLTFPKLQTLN